MAMLTRRGLMAGLGAVAGVRLDGRVRAQPAGLSGHLYAVRGGGFRGDREEGLSVVDLAAGGDETHIEVGMVDSLIRVGEPSWAVATVPGGAWVVDPSGERAAPIQVRDGSATGGGDFGDDRIIPLPEPAASARYAVLGVEQRLDGNLYGLYRLPRWLVDTEQATVADLSAQYDADPSDSYERPNGLAAMLPEDRLLIEPEGSLLVVSCADLSVERDLVPDRRIFAPRLAPGGALAGCLVGTGNGSESALLTIPVDGSSPPAEVHRDGRPGLALAWVDDATIVCWAGLDARSELTKVDLATGTATAVSDLMVIAWTPAVVADGTRLLTGARDGETLAWWLTDVAAGTSVPLTDLAGCAPAVGLRRSDRHVLFGPAAGHPYPTWGQAGEQYLVLDADSGAVVPLIDRVENQYYLGPSVSRDGAWAAVDMRGDAGEALWLCDLAAAEATRIDGYTRPIDSGAFSPDGQHVLMRGTGDDAPLEVRSLDGQPIAELGPFARAWWFG